MQESVKNSLTKCPAVCRICPHKSMDGDDACQRLLAGRFTGVQCVASLFRQIGNKKQTVTNKQWPVVWQGNAVTKPFWETMHLTFVRNNLCGGRAFAVTFHWSSRNKNRLDKQPVRWGEGGIIWDKTFVRNNLQHKLQQADDIVVSGVTCKNLCCANPLVFPTGPNNSHLPAINPADFDSQLIQQVLDKCFSNATQDNFLDPAFQDCLVQSISKRAEKVLWHQRLAHCSIRVLNHAQRLIKLTGPAISWRMVSWLIPTRFFPFTIRSKLTPKLALSRWSASIPNSLPNVSTERVSNHVFVLPCLMASMLALLVKSMIFLLLAKPNLKPQFVSLRLAPLFSILVKTSIPWKLLASLKNSTVLTSLRLATASNSICMATSNVCLNPTIGSLLWNVNICLALVLLSHCPHLSLKNSAMFKVPKSTRQSTANLNLNLSLSVALSLTNFFGRMPCAVATLAALLSPSWNLLNVPQNATVMLSSASQFAFTTLRIGASFIGVRLLLSISLLAMHLFLIVPTLVFFTALLCHPLLLAALILLMPTISHIVAPLLAVDFSSSVTQFAVKLRPKQSLTQAAPKQNFVLLFLMEKLPSFAISFARTWSSTIQINQALCKQRLCHQCHQCQLTH